MDPDREEEILLNIACGLDSLTAIASASDADDDKPPKRTDLGCLSVTLLVVAGIVVWAVLLVVGF